MGRDTIETIGRFEVARELGVGSTGVVFEARDPELDRTIAIKVLHAGGDEARLRAEARALARLRHPNVVAVHDVGTWNGKVFVTMDHVAGATFGAWVAARRRGWREIVACAVRAGRGLCAAHRAGVVHGDVKAANVLVGDDGEVRVVDFGLAPSLSPRFTPSLSGPFVLSEPRSGESKDAAAVATAAGSHDAHPAIAVGTATSPDGAHVIAMAMGSAMSAESHVIAPEIAAGGAPDTQSDQYAFAAMLSHALGDRRVPSRVRRALSRACSADPAARFANLDALIAELDRDRTALRRWAIAAAITGAVLAIAAGAILLTARKPAGDPCGAGPARIASTWSPARRAAIERAFTATGVPYASTSAATATGGLDRYAIDWVGGYRASCRATHVEHAQSAAAQDLRTRCLDRRLASLASTVDVLARADTDTVGHAAALVEALPPVAACADGARLAIAAPPPSDPARRAQLAQLEARLADARAELTAAHYGRAIDLAAALLPDARALGHAPFMAEVLLALGDAQGEAGDDASAATWREALTLAQASHADEVVADAALALCDRYSLTDPASSHAWARLAGATIEHLGSPPIPSARYEDSLTALYAAENRDDEALPHGLAAIAILDASGARDTLAYADALASLSYVLDAAGAMDAALARGRQSQALIERLLGRDHPRLATVLNNLAFEEERLGRYDDALAGYRRAYDILVGVHQHEARLGSQLLDSQGEVLDRLGRPEEAIALKQRALAQRLAASPDGDRWVAESYESVGVSMQRAARHGEALAMHDKALALRIRLDGETSAITAASYMNRGVDHFNLRQFADAAADCGRAVAIEEVALGRLDPELMAALECLGVSEMTLGHDAAGIAAFERGVAIADRTSLYPERAAALRSYLARARAP